VGQRQLPSLTAPTAAGGPSGAPAKDAHVQQRVAHQPVAAVDSADASPATKAGTLVCSRLDGHAAVLIVEGGVDQHRS